MHYENMEMRKQVIEKERREEREREERMREEGEKEEEREKRSEKKRNRKIFDPSDDYTKQVIILNQNHIPEFIKKGEKDSK